MPSTRSYDDLHAQVLARPGAAERLTALREKTLEEIGLHETRRAAERSTSDMVEDPAIRETGML